jgi:DNA-binding XRE family transcriptional regulator
MDDNLPDPENEENINEIKRSTRVVDPLALARGDIIRIARMRMGLTQHELGQALGSLTKVTLCRYEQGQRMPPLITVMAVKYLLLQHVRKIMREHRRAHKSQQKTPAP